MVADSDGGGDDAGGHCRKGVEDNQRIRRRRHRDRIDSTTSSSVYFTASPGITSANEENSEAGYVCLTSHIELLTQNHNYALEVVCAFKIKTRLFSGTRRPTPTPTIRI